MVDVIKRRITGVSDDSPADGQVEIDMANISPASFLPRLRLPPQLRRGRL